MTAADALKDKFLVKLIAAKARIDERTVKRALEGGKGKGLAYDVALKAIAEAGIDLPGDGPTLSLVAGGKGSK